MNAPKNAVTPKTEAEYMLTEIGARIRELRLIADMSTEDMARATEVTVEAYEAYEEGREDLPFTFVHKCALLFGVEMTEILEGRQARLQSYTVTRSGEGQLTAREDGNQIVNLAAEFRSKIAEPYRVLYTYSEAEQNKPIHLTTHGGQEFDLILEGQLKVQVGEHVEILNPGDSIYYDSGTPHGMIAVGGQDCLFCAVVLPGEEEQTAAELPVQSPKKDQTKEPRIYERFVETVTDETGLLKDLRFKNVDRFNFAFDIVDALAATKPGKVAMLHVDNQMTERYFTFSDLSRYSNKAANYFASLGIQRGDRVMLVLKRHYQFWLSILALHKLGAIAIPATNQLMQKDFEYRFEAAGVSAIVCTGDGEVAAEAMHAAEHCPTMQTLIMANVPQTGVPEGWHDFDQEFRRFSDEYIAPANAPGGDDPMLMLFTSGTTGYPKIAAHSYKYPLGHFVTARYWHCVDPEGLHLTISETGWGKALWGKLYGQWMCEGATFVYDFDRFNAADILPMFAKYNITTFCAPPTMYRMLIKQDLSGYDLSSIQHATTAGEALNPEVFHQFKKATGLSVMEGFGQTETALVIGNIVGMTPKIGSMGKPVPGFDVDVVDAEGNRCPDGITGEIVIHTDKGIPMGLYMGYYRNEAATADSWHDGLYHTGDTAWRDEDGYYWYVSRVDDVIKSSGYRIGPFEIESVIMELPYVLECGVSAAPDPVRGQVVKASIVLVKGAEGSDELKKEIQNYVKSRTAPYKYPRIVVFKDELPKTTSGKIIRKQL